MASVLVVDDSIFTRNSLKSLLNQAGHEVVAEAGNGLQAFAEYKEHKPDIVTMDVSMPIVNGVDATKNIIEVFPDANIVMISAVAEKHLIFESLQLGAKHYIIKPFDYNNVVSVINRVLNESTQKMELPESSENNSKVTGGPSINQYFIEHKSGKFIINILDNIDSQGYDSLKNAIKELIYIKPLKIVLNFGNIKELSDADLHKVIDFSDRVRNLKGVIELASENEEFVRFIEANHPNVKITYCENSYLVSQIQI